MPEKMLLEELDSCYEIIFGEGFKLKWMEHCVDVLRAVNLLFRLYTKAIPNETRLRVVKLCL